ncbi:MAG: LCP family protein [Eubacterium sp.]|nr:LCP family protein [Eubacterium sp.]
MGTPDYDLDDILNEIINKNVGEDIKAKMDEIDKAKEALKKEEDKPEKEEPKPQIKEDVNPKKEMKPSEISPAKAPEPKKEESKAEAVKKEKKPEVPEKTAAANASATVVYKDEPKKEEPKIPAKPPVKMDFNIDEPFLESNREVPNDEADASVNLFELGGYETENMPRRARKDKNKNSKKKWRKTKVGKICISLILVLAIAIVGTGGYAVWYVNDMLNGITQQDPDTPNTTTDEWKGMDEFYENFETINENEYSSSYRDMVKKWYYNGEPVSSSNVLNVMLIGEDTRGDEISESGTRADSAIIGSVNTQTGEIVLTSILRDSYIYYETTPGDESTGRYGKINGAMAFGGVDCYINAVERMFKVNIDNYVIVNFTSFQKIIDSLGGVTVTMSAAEIREINNHPNTYGGVSISGEAGDLLLSGEQALAYCRIRHLDSDNVRADRQKTVLLSLFKKVKDASTMKLAELATTLMPYVKTGFSKKEILSIGQYALSHGWISYKTVTYTVPTNETNTDGTTLTTCKGGTYYGEWIWKVDCPLAAQILQKKIYGKTSISLAENRQNFASLSDY